MSEVFKQPRSGRVDGSSWLEHCTTRLKLGAWILRCRFGMTLEHPSLGETCLEVPKDHIGQAAPIPGTDVTQEFIWVSPHPSASLVPRYLQEAEGVVEEVQARVSPTACEEMPAYVQDILNMGVLDLLDE